MDKLSKTIPIIEFICKGSNNKRSFSATQLFKYRFSKDICSPFVLNSQNINLIKKHYIKLRLVEEIKFADSETTHEYAIQKSAFIRKIKRKYKDSKFIIEERKYIPGLKNYNSISIKNKEPRSIGFCNLFLFILLTFGEFYKIYFNSLCSYQSFTIEKVVTTHSYLNQNDFEKDYENKKIN